MQRWKLECACGWTTVGTEAEVVAAAQEHGTSLHNMDVSYEQAMTMATRVE